MWTKLDMWGPLFFSWGSSYLLLPNLLAQHKTALWRFPIRYELLTLSVSVYVNTTNKKVLLHKHKRHTPFSWSGTWMGGTPNLLTGEGAGTPILLMRGRVLPILTWDENNLILTQDRVPPPSRCELTNWKQYLPPSFKSGWLSCFSRSREQGFRTIQELWDQVWYLQSFLCSLFFHPLLYVLQ